MRASPKPTLLVAEDAAGPVLLALANMDGGGGRGPGSVAVDLDSTAITLVGLTAGIAVSDMTHSIISLIFYHQQYPALVADLTRRMRADTNFLARLYDSPGTERLLQEVAEPLTIAAIPQAVGASSSSQGSRSYATDIDASPHTAPSGALTQTAGVGAGCGQSPGDSVWNDPGLRERIQMHALSVADIVFNISNNRKLGEDLADLRIHKETIDACERSQQRQWLRNNPDRIDIFDGPGVLQFSPPDLLRHTLHYRQAVPGFQQACRDIHRVPKQQLSPTEQAFTLAAIIPPNKFLKTLPWIGPILEEAWEAKKRKDTENALLKLIDDIKQTIEECGQDEEEEEDRDEEEEEDRDRDEEEDEDTDEEGDDAREDDEDDGGSDSTRWCRYLTIVKETGFPEPYVRTDECTDRYITKCNDDVSLIDRSCNSCAAYVAWKNAGPQEPSSRPYTYELAEEYETCEECYADRLFPTHWGRGCYQ